MTLRLEKRSSSRIAAIGARRDPKRTARIQKTMELAAAIEDAMNRKGWSRKKFALELDVQPSQITRWLSGTQGINTDSLFDIEYVLGERFVLQERENQDLTKPFRMEMRNVTVFTGTIASFNNSSSIVDVLSKVNKLTTHSLAENLDALPYQFTIRRISSDDSGSGLLNTPNLYAMGFGPTTFMPPQICSWNNKNHYVVGEQNKVGI